MRRIFRHAFTRVISTVLSLALALGPALSVVRPANASEPSEPATPTALVSADTAGTAVSTPQSVDASPTVVGELMDKRTDSAQSFLLSDGNVRTEVAGRPVRFMDEAGQWTDIDPRLVPADHRGAVESAATSLTATFDAQHATGSPVTLAGDGYSVGMDYLGAAENARLDMGDTATYLGIATDTSLEYQSRYDGIKETFLLASAAAPTSYAFSLKLNGLEVRRTLTGYALFRKGESVPTLDLGALTVSDSKNGVEDGVACPDATMTVADAGDGTARVTYEFSRAWLSDPARVFPVRVDPTVTISGTGPTDDTYVTSASPTSVHGAADFLGVGDLGSDRRLSYLWFNIASAGVSTSAYVKDAHLQVFQTRNAAGGADMRWGTNSSPGFNGNTNYNNKPGFVVQGTTPCPSTNTWLDIPGCQAVVQGWLSGASTNYGFALSQALSSGTYREYRSSESADTSHLPKLVIEYSNPSVMETSVLSAYRIGDTVTAKIRVDTVAVDDINCIKAYVNGTADSDMVATRRGTFQWTKTAPSTGWDWGGVTNTPGSGGGRVSSLLTTAGASTVDLMESQCYQDVNPTGGYAEITFVWKILSGYGNVQNNDIDVQVMMDPVDKNDTGNRWTSSIKKMDTDFDVLPALPVARASVSTTEDVAWTPILFDATRSTAGTGTLSYAWDFENDGAVDSTSATATHDYMAAGAHTWTLTVTDSLGATSTALGVVTVISGPRRGIAATTASAIMANPVLVFVTGWNNTAMEYGQNAAGLPSNAEDDRAFTNLIAELALSYRIVKVPSQKEGKRRASYYPSACMCPTASVEANGDRILNYLKRNPTVSYITNGRRVVRPYIFVTFSKGGLDVRRFLDMECKQHTDGSKFRGSCLGVLQIATPNEGSQYAVVEFGRWLALNRATHPGITDKQVRDIVMDADRALWDLRPIMWNNAAATDYNDQFSNGAEDWESSYGTCPPWQWPRPYVRMAGNGQKRDIWGRLAGTNDDGVVTVWSAQGSGSSGTYGRLSGNGAGGKQGFAKWETYGLHGFQRTTLLPLRLTGYYPHAASLLGDKRYVPTDAVETSAIRGFFADYKWAINCLKIPWRTVASAPGGQRVSAAWEDAGAEYTGEGGLARFEVVPGQEVTETVSLTTGDSFTVEGLPPAARISVVDMNGVKAAVESTTLAAEYGGDEETQTISVVSVEATGTYSVSMSSPTTSLAAISELSGPSLVVSMPPVVDGSMPFVASVRVTDDPRGSEGDIDLWDVNIRTDDATVSALDNGVWPDEAVGDGIASVLVPPPGTGSQAVSISAVQLTGSAAGRARVAVEPITGVDVGSLEVLPGVTIGRQLDGEGLTSGVAVSAPISNNADTTRTVALQFDLITDNGQSSVQLETTTEVPPLGDATGTVILPAEQLCGAAPASSVTVSAVRILPCQPPVDGDFEKVAGADNVPIAETRPAGLELEVQDSELAVMECSAYLESSWPTTNGIVSLVGSAAWGGHSIDRVEYSLDETHWYSAVPTDGAWGSSGEAFRFDFVAPQGDGPFVLQIRPVTDGARWDGGQDVGLTVDSE
jgi:PKD repeat protein